MLRRTLNVFRRGPTSVLGKQVRSLKMPVGSSTQEISNYDNNYLNWLMDNKPEIKEAFPAEALEMEKCTGRSYWGPKPTPQKKKNTTRQQQNEDRFYIGAFVYSPPNGEPLEDAASALSLESETTQWNSIKFASNMLKYPETCKMAADWVRGYGHNLEHFVLTPAHGKWNQDAVNILDALVTNAPQHLVKVDLALPSDAKTEARFSGPVNELIAKLPPVTVLHLYGDEKSVSNLMQFLEDQGDDATLRVRSLVISSKAKSVKFNKKALEEKVPYNIFGTSDLLMEEKKKSIVFKVAGTKDSRADEDESE